MIDMDTLAVGRTRSRRRCTRPAAAAEAAERLLAGDARAAFAALRPPGHHAERARAMGFCLFNNAAVAAAHAIEACGAERVLILDWDVHHGNGTEEIFAASPEVLYASIHQWPLYPGTGAAEYEGTGEGEGLHGQPAGAGRHRRGRTFLALVEHVVAPIARAYGPGLLLISAGYDAHRDDPLASCAVDTEALRRDDRGDAGRRRRARRAQCWSAWRAVTRRPRSPTRWSRRSTALAGEHGAARRAARGRRAAPEPPARALAAVVRGPSGP